MFGLGDVQKGEFSYNGVLLPPLLESTDDETLYEFLGDDRVDTRGVAFLDESADTLDLRSELLRLYMNKISSKIVNVL